MSTKILSLELENVKRVSLVQLTMSERGLTIIGGDNAQGKTSVLDAICYALGGEKYRPTDIKRNGALADPSISLTLSNGLIVRRQGKNSALKVIDPLGRKCGQSILSSFTEELALNMPKFLQMTEEGKALMLLQSLGIGAKLEEIDQLERLAYEKRQSYYQIVDQKRKYATELPEYHDAPDTPLSAGELMEKFKVVIDHNEKIEREVEKCDILEETIACIAKTLTEFQTKLAEATEELSKSKRFLCDNNKKSTEEIEREIQNIEAINIGVRANSDKQKALADAEECEYKYSRLSIELENIRAERRKLLESASMPLGDLSITKNERERPVLCYKNMRWDGMSSMEKIRVATAIIRYLKPECGFVLLDGLECFDRMQLAELDKWLESENLQAIATRVSRGDECSIIIEDGVAVQAGLEKEMEW